MDGAVLVLVDIDTLKRSEDAIAAARDYAEAIVSTVRDPLLILNADLRVHKANEAFYNTFKVGAAETEGCMIYELGNRQWNIPRLRELLEEILPRNDFFNNFEVTHEFKNIGRRMMLGQRLQAERHQGSARENSAGHPGPDRTQRSGGRAARRRRTQERVPGDASA